MKIIKNKSIRMKYCEGFKRIIPISEIIIHGTGGGNSTDSLILWMLTGERKDMYKKGIGLFHYCIDLDGTVTEIIDPDRWVYHSGSGKHDEETIGIELINTDPNNNAPYTEKQYEALFGLILNIMDIHNINVVYGHGICQKQYSQKYKNCPGNFNWIKLENFLLENLFNFDKGFEIIYNIKKGKRK